MLTVRDATPVDAPAIAEIYAWHVLNGTGSCEEVAPPIEEIASRMAVIAERGLPWLIAEGDDGVLGYGYAMPYRPRSAYRFTVEDAVYVHHAHHGQGIGRTLLRDLIDRARALRHHTIVALIDADQAASIALHARQGFVEAGRLKQVGFKFGRWLDVVYMRRET